MLHMRCTKIQRVFDTTTGGTPFLSPSFFSSPRFSISRVTFWWRYCCCCCLRARKGPLGSVRNKVWFYCCFSGNNASHDTLAQDTTRPTNPRSRMAVRSCWRFRPFRPTPEPAPPSTQQGKPSVKKSSAPHPRPKLGASKQIQDAVSTQR